MKKFKAQFDTSTWGFVALIFVACAWPLLLGFDWVVLIISVACIAICLFPFFSIWYAIEGEELIVYQFCVPSRFPIMKIKEIKPTKTMLASPATSLTDRIAISFTDRKVLKSSSPLVISPADKEKFYQTLLSINPDIVVVG